MSKVKLSECFYINLPPGKAETGHVIVYRVSHLKQPFRKTTSLALNMSKTTTTTTCKKTKSVFVIIYWVFFLK